MRPVEWDESFTIGHSQIDREHQALMLMVNQLVESFDQLADRETIVARLMAVTVALEAHFGFEEGVMTGFSYPHADKHQEAHRELSRLMRAMIGDAQDKPALEKAFTLIISALYDHIRGYDGMFSVFLVENNFFGLI